MADDIVNDMDEQVDKLSAEIAALVREFESHTEIRVDALSIDNRMRSVGGCSPHQILVCAETE